MVASKLVPGEIVDQLDGEGERVVSVERERDLQDTYNFEVAEAHTYFVGQSRAWVHNQSYCNSNVPLTKDYFESVYGGAGNVQQGGGIALQTAEKIAAEGVVGVPAWVSPNPLSPVQQVDAYGNEIFYRTMSPVDYATLRDTGNLPPTTETSISPVLSYSSKYAGVTVEFTVAPGTSQQLQQFGIAANPPAAAVLPDLSTQTGPWMQTNTRFKVEGGQMSTQLGQGPGIDLFNQNIILFKKLP